MNVLRWIVLLSAVALPAADSFGQQNSHAISPMSTAVQLPTFSFFGVGTTVSVPDRGSTYMGGVNRSAEGMNEFGTPLLPFRNRSFGRESSATSTRMSVYVHDFEAMDEYLLSQPTAFNQRPQPAPAAQPAKVAVGEQGPPRPVVDAAALRAQHQREEQARASEASDLVARAQAAEASGKPGVAKVYYQMAARRASGSLKDQIVARLAALSAPSSPTLVQDR
jgi:hypothetical protein